MKFIVIVIVIVILMIVSTFTYMKLNPIEPIEPFKEIMFKKTAVIDKPIIQTKILPKSKPIRRKILPKPKPPRLNKTYHCDRRIYCSQMRSCEEAKFFIRNCRGTKMDGDGDGIPCERQWCH